MRCPLALLIFVFSFCCNNQVCHAISLDQTWLSIGFPKENSSVKLRPGTMDFPPGSSVSISVEDKSKWVDSNKPPYLFEVGKVLEIKFYAWRESKQFVVTVLAMVQNVHQKEENSNVLNEKILYSFSIKPGDKINLKQLIKIGVIPLIVKATTKSDSKLN